MYLSPAKRAKKYARLSAQRATELLAVTCKSVAAAIPNGISREMFSRF